MRIYLAATLAQLGRLVADRSLAPQVAFAVTPRLRATDDAPEDVEDLEFLAFTAAAGASLQLLADEPAAPPRRVVVSADVPEGRVAAADAGAETAPGEVALAAPLDLSEVVAVHVDDEAFAARVAALLRRGAAAAEDGDADEDLLEEVMAEPMQWFATQELAPLLIDQDGFPGPSSVVG